MNNTLIIHDTTGYIIQQVSGSYRVPIGIPYLEIEIPTGKILKSIDTSVTPNVAIYEDIPKTELQLTQEQVLATQAQLASLQEQILLK